MSTGVEIISESTANEKKSSLRGFTHSSGVRPNFTMVSGGEFMEKGEHFGSKKSIAFTRSALPNIDGYLSGMCAGKTKQI
jgi:hypothetical protein